MMPDQPQAFTRTTAGMKVLLYVASGLVLAVGLTLFLFPGQTDTLFSRTVNPPLTATRPAAELRHKNP